MRVLRRLEIYGCIQLNISMISFTVSSYENICFWSYQDNNEVRPTTFGEKEKKSIIEISSSR